MRALTKKLGSYSNLHFSLLKSFVREGNQIQKGRRNKVDLNHKKKASFFVYVNIQISQKTLQNLHKKPYQGRQLDTVKGKESVFSKIPTNAYMKFSFL